MRFCWVCYFCGLSAFLNCKTGTRALTRVVRATSTNVRKTHYLARSRCSTAQEKAGLGFLVFFLTGTHNMTLQRACTLHLALPQRSQGVISIFTSLPSTNFAVFLHNNKTQKWFLKFGDHQFLSDSANPHSNAHSSWHIGIKPLISSSLSLELSVVYAIQGSWSLGIYNRWGHGTQSYEITTTKSTTHYKAFL